MSSETLFTDKQMLSGHLHATLRHVITWASIVAAIFLVCFFFGPRRTITAPNIGVNTPLAQQTAAPVAPIVIAPGFAQPPSSGLDYGYWTQWLNALAHQRTVPSVNVQVQTPKPGPVPTPPPGLTADQTKFIHDLAKQADEEAIAESTVAVTVTQVPAPPSRWSSLGVVNHGVGIGYAVSQRGQFDLDATVLYHDGHLAPGASVVWNIPHSGAGFGPGVVYENHKLQPGVTFSFRI